MSALRREVNGTDVVSEIRSLASPLAGADDLDPLVDRVATVPFRLHRRGLARHP
jgi:hypothetical protein